MKQLNLFARNNPVKEGLSRRTDPVSSLEAGREVVKTGTSSHHREIILSHMEIYPLTNSQLASRAGLDQYQVTRRMTELERMGKVERGPIVECPILGRKAGTWRLL